MIVDILLRFAENTPLPMEIYDFIIEIVLLLI